MARILIIDDEISILETLEMFLSEKGHHVYKTSTGKTGLDVFFKLEPEVVILDIRLPDINGLEILSEIQSKDRSTKVIMITAFHDMETTIEAMKRGGYDYIHKPLDADEVERAINRALNTLEADRETPLLKNSDKPLNREVFIGKSEKIKDIFKTIGLLCQNRATILIQGETGTGKELIARIIHHNSLISNEPFVTFDCSAVVETLIESELFGHEKGTFTGANHLQRGKIELAGKGTLFLDEVGELPPGLQGKFLGFLQRKEFMRIGGENTIKSHCRIIAATNRDLSLMVKQRQYKEDLYFRLKVMTITVPPLSERMRDIPDLVNHFLQKINLEFGTKVTKIQTGVMERLMEHNWKGNVRELENVLVQAIIQAKGKIILLDDVKKILATEPNNETYAYFSGSLPEMEKEHIKATLQMVDWNRTKAAKLLGISLPTLRQKIRKYEIVVPLS